MTTELTIDAGTLLGIHRTMLTIRLFEQRVAREFRTGEIGRASCRERV